MKTSVINTVVVDTTKQPMFFGEDLSVQRFDKFREKKFYDSWLTQLEFMWRPDEFALS